MRSGWSRWPSTGDEVNPATLREVLAIPQPSTRHHGGNIVFGPDGLLWLVVGDGSPGEDPANAAQSLGVLSGKLLRLDPTPRPATNSRSGTVPMPSVVKHLLPASTTNRSRCAELRHLRLVVE